MENNYHYEPIDEEKNNAPLIIGIVVSTIIILASYLVYKYIYLPKKIKEETTQVFYEQPKSTYTSSSNNNIMNDDGITQILGDGQYITVIDIKKHEYVIYNNERTKAVSITHSASCKLD